MALSYTSGTAANQVELLEDWRDFCITSNDWVLDEEHAETYSAYGASENDAYPDGKVVHMHRTDSYGQTAWVHMYACYRAWAFPFIPQWTEGTDLRTYKGIQCRDGQNNGISFMASRGYNAGHTAWWDHTTPTYSKRNNMGGGANGGICGTGIGMMIGQTLNYWFYHHGDSFHCVVEVFPNEYMHMSMGTLVKSGTYDGGQYISGSSAAIYGGCHPDSGTTWAHESAPYKQDSSGNTAGNYHAPNFHVYCGDETAGWCGSHTWNYPPENGIPYSVIIGLPGYHGSTSNFKWYASLMFGSPSSLTSLAPQFPLYIRRVRESNYENSYLGYPEGVRCLNMKALSSQQTKTLGSDVWQVFPAGRIDPSRSYYTIAVPGLSYLQ